MLSYIKNKLYYILFFLRQFRDYIYYNILFIPYSCITKLHFNKLKLHTDKIGYIKFWGAR